MEHKIRRPKSDMLELTIIKIVGKRLTVEAMQTSGEVKVVLAVRLSHNENKNYEEKKDAKCNHCCREIQIVGNWFKSGAIDGIKFNFEIKVLYLTNRKGRQ